MAKITPRNESSTVVVRTKPDAAKAKPGDWWNATSKKEMVEKLLATAAFLKEQNQYRYRQASLYARLYGNMPLFNAVGANLMRMGTKNQLPSDRPTMSVITSCTDTIVSRLSQARPRPIFLTDNGDYKQRNLAKQLNQFIAGELYQTKAYELGPLILRDSCIFGTGAIKVLEDQKNRVALERRLSTQILLDANESFLGDPRQLIETTLVDRSVLEKMFPGKGAAIDRAENAYPDSSSESERTVSDQVMLVEGWHLPSGPNAGDGLHVIACTSGDLHDADYDKERFPFVFEHYSPPIVGPWGQGLAERLLGNQNGINGLLMTIHRAINIMGVPRVWIEDGSKVVKANINNEIGMIGTYRGTKPIFETAQSVHPELYQQLERLIKFAYNQEGISELAAVGQKPAGLNSGTAQREYDDIQSDRFAALQKRYENMYVELAYLIIDKARDIAKRDGKYQTVFPDKNGAKEIDLPAADLLDNPFVIQCFDTSSLPRDPAGRAQKIIEYMQAGLYTPQEGRRLLGFADTEQEDKLLNAGEERILKILDDIVEEGKFTPPDPFMDLGLAEQIVTQYYNLYAACKLEEDKAEMLRNFFSQVQALKAQATSAMAPPMSQYNLQPQALPQAQEQSPMIPNVPGGA
jgi:hypothetical protein